MLQPKSLSLLHQYRAAAAAPAQRGLSCSRKEASSSRARQRHSPVTQGWTTKPRVAGCTAARAADCGMNWRDKE